MSQLTFNGRVLSELLTKYPNTFVALCELLNNSIQADASEIHITIDYAPASELTHSAIQKIVVRDNGVGVQKTEFKWKMLEVGTEAKKDGKGVGRFAPFQLGTKMTIETVAYDKLLGKWFKSELPVNISNWNTEKLESITLNDAYTAVEKQNSYYQVTIENFYGEDVTKKETHKRVSKSLLAANIEGAIFAAYPEKVFQRSVKFVINGKALNPDDFVVGQPDCLSEQFTTLHGETHNIDYKFVQVKTIGKHRVFLRVENNGVQSVAHSFDYEVEVPEPNQWFVLVDSSYFNAKADTFRNFPLYDENPQTEHLVQSIKAHVDSFFGKKYAQYKDFLTRLRGDSYYPYKGAHKSSSQSRTAVFNQFAYYVEGKHHLLAHNEKVRELVYGLMDKALDGGEFEDLLERVLKLDEDLVKRFRNLLERVDLENVISFSEDTVKKQQYLDFLHKLVYSEISKHVKERSQLHKVVERQLWIFGEAYNGTPKLFSDKNLWDNLEALRKEFFKGEPTKDDDNLVEIGDEKTREITDLFFFNEKITDNQKREIMVVELKAPKVRLSDKELKQARDYALQISKRGVFPRNHSYKILLVGSDMNEAVKVQCGKDPKNPYLHQELDNGRIQVWAILWSDLIEQNRTKLSYLGNALKTKDQNVREVFETEFNDIELQKLDSVLEPTAESKAKGKMNAAKKKRP